MSNFYYLYKFGGYADAALDTTGTLESSVDFDNGNTIWGGSAVGAIFEDSNFGADSENVLDFLFNKDTTNTAYNTDGWNEFYEEYKNATGSDILSYLNGYVDTSELALGDMKNVTNNGIDHTFSITNDYESFSFFETYDGELYRFTEQYDKETIRADVGSDDADYANMSDVESAVNAYITHREADPTVRYSGTTAVNLADLGIDYASVSAAFGGSVTEMEQYYQRVIDQMVSELKELKPMTITEENEQEMIKAIQEKQAGLKAIDDAIYGFVEDGGTASVDAYDYTHDFNITNLSGSYGSYTSADGFNFDKLNTVINTIQTEFGTGSNLVNIINALDAVEVQDVAAGASPDVKDIPYFKSELKEVIYAYLEANPQASDLPDDVQITSAENTIANRDNGSKDLTDVLAVASNQSYLATQVTSADLAGKYNDIKGVIDLWISNGTLDASTSESDEVAKYLWKTMYTQDEFAERLSDLMLSGADPTVTVDSAVLDPNAVVQDVKKITERIDDVRYPYGDKVLVFDKNDFLTDFDSVYKESWSNGWTWTVDNAESASELAGKFYEALQAADADTGADADDGESYTSIDGDQVAITIDVEDLMSDYGYTDASQIKSEDYFKYVIYKYAGWWDDTPWLAGADKYGFRESGWDDRAERNKADDIGRAFVKGLQMASSVQSIEPSYALGIRDTKNILDDESIMYEMMDYFLTGVNGQGQNAIDNPGAALYLSEVSAAIIEQYWVENFNEEEPADPIEYFDLKFRNYFDIEGSNGKLNIPFVGPDGTSTNFSLDFTKSGMSAVDYIMESSSFAKLMVKMEDRTRLEMELFEMTTALDVSANVYNQEYMYRLGVLSSMDKDLSTLTGLSFDAITDYILTVGSPTNANPFWEDYFPWFKGFYGNIPEGATVEEMFDDDGNLKLSMMAAGGGMVDPYVVNINNVDYIMGVDENNSGTIDDAKEILGITDTKEDLFKSLYALDSDEDGYISQQELKANNIIFDAVNTSHRFNNSTIDTDFVRGIDLTTIEEADGTNNIFGNFSVEMTNGKQADAIQTFQSQGYFNNLFGSFVDLSFVEESQNAEKVEDTEVIEEVVEVKDVVTTKYEQFAKQAQNIFSQSIQTKEEVEIADSKEAEETTSLVEEQSEKVDIENYTLVNNGEEITVSKLIEDILWKSGVDRLSSTQRYDILGSIDVSLPVDMIQRKIEEKIEAFQISA